MDDKGQGMFAPEQLVKLLIAVVVLLLIIGILDMVFNKGGSLLGGVFGYVKNLVRGLV